MLLTLIRFRTTRYRCHAVLYERSQWLGNRILGKIAENKQEARLELFYRVTVTKSGICINDQPSKWIWTDKQQKSQTEAYLKHIQHTGEEIRIEYTHWEPDFPDYPRQETEGKIFFPDDV